MEQRIIGVIPMAGKGQRLGLLPFSKELYPIGFWETQVGDEIQKRPKTVTHYLLDGYRTAGINLVYLILSPKKADIFQYFGSGRRFGVEISYIYIEESKGMPFTLDALYNWLTKGDIVVFGMADTIICPHEVFKKLVDDFTKKQPDLLLGAFKTDEPWKFGMIEIDSNMQVTCVVDKPKETQLDLMWGNACWSTKFSDFMHAYLKDQIKAEKEVVFSDVIRAAIEQGLNIQASCFEEGTYLDVGTIDDLQKGIDQYT
jgi:glucose-1-phosphate thymidylyltransferase